MINRTNSEARRIGKRVALTRSILRRFNWRRTPETTIKINCSNNGDLVADESAYRSTIETRDWTPKKNSPFNEIFFDISILQTNF